MPRARKMDEKATMVEIVVLMLRGGLLHAASQRPYILLFQQSWKFDFDVAMSESLSPRVRYQSAERRLHDWYSSWVGCRCAVASNCRSILWSTGIGKRPLGLY